MTRQTIDWDPDRQETAHKAADALMGTQQCVRAYGLASGCRINEQIDHQRVKICWMIEKARKKNPDLDQRRPVTISVRRVPGYEDYTMITGRLSQGAVV